MRSHPCLRLTKVHATPWLQKRSAVPRAGHAPGRVRTCRHDCPQQQCTHFPPPPPAHPVRLLCLQFVYGDAPAIAYASRTKKETASHSRQVGACHASGGMAARLVTCSAAASMQKEGMVVSWCSC